MLITRVNADMRLDVSGANDLNADLDYREKVAILNEVVNSLPGIIQFGQVFEAIEFLHEIHFFYISGKN